MLKIQIKPWSKNKSVTNWNETEEIGIIVPLLKMFTFFAKLDQIKGKEFPPKWGQSDYKAVFGS